MDRVVYIVCHCNSTKRIQICHLLYRTPANAGVSAVCVCYVLPLLLPQTIVCGRTASVVFGRSRQDWWVIDSPEPVTWANRSPFPKIKIHVKLMQRSNLLLLIMLYTMASLVNPQCPLLWDHLQPNCWKRFCFRSDNSVMVLAMVARSGYFPSFSLFSRGNTRRAGDVHDHSSHKGN